MYPRKVEPNITKSLPGNSIFEALRTKGLSGYCIFHVLQGRFIGHLSSGEPYSDLSRLRYTPPQMPSFSSCFPKTLSIRSRRYNRDYRSVFTSSTQPEVTSTILNLPKPLTSAVTPPQRRAPIEYDCDACRAHTVDAIRLVRHRNQCKAVRTRARRAYEKCVQLYESVWQQKRVQRWRN
jgi:hypothetical protein